MLFNEGRGLVYSEAYSSFVNYAINSPNNGRLFSPILTSLNGKSSFVSFGRTFLLRIYTGLNKSVCRVCFLQTSDKTQLCRQTPNICLLGTGFHR